MRGEETRFVSTRATATCGGLGREDALRGETWTAPEARTTASPRQAVRP
jgi:hypothetical protein